MYPTIVLTVLCIASVGFALPLQEQETRDVVKRQTGDFSAVWNTCGDKYTVEITYSITTPHGAFTMDFVIRHSGGGAQVATGSLDFADGTGTSDPITWDHNTGSRDTYEVVATIHGEEVVEDLGPMTYGTGCKEPHLMTFDGYRYNYHGYCSYTMMKSCDDSIYPSFEVTADFRARNQNHPYSPPTFMVAFDVIVNGKQLIRLNEDDSVLIEGNPLTGQSAVIGANEGRIDQRNGEVTIRLDNLGFTVSWIRQRHGLSIGLADSNLNGKVCGLLGNADGNPKNDFIKPDGQRTFISEDFGNSWEVLGSCP